jgi:hypothetical protein
MARSTCWIASLVVQASLFGLLLGLLFTPTLDTTGNKFNVNAADGEAHDVAFGVSDIACTVGENTADAASIESTDTAISDTAISDTAISGQNGDYSNDCMVWVDKTYRGTGDKLGEPDGDVCNGSGRRCPTYLELKRAHSKSGGILCGRVAGPCDIPYLGLTSFNSKYNTYVRKWAVHFSGYTKGDNFGTSVAYANRLGPHVGFEELTTEIGDQLYTEGVLLWISVALTFVTFVLLACADADDDTWIPGNSSKYVRAAGALTNLVLLATFSTILAKMVDSSPNEGDDFARTVDMNTVPDHFLGNFHIPELRDEIPEFVYFENSRTPALEAMILTIAGAVLLAVNVGIWARRDGEHGYTVLGFLHL